MLNTYLSPGVYVKEVASGSAPIAGVGTSTAGFIGVIKRASEDNPNEDLEIIAKEDISVNSIDQKVFTLQNHPGTENIICKVKVNDSEAPAAHITQNEKTKKYQINVTEVEVSPPITSINVEYGRRKLSAVPTPEVKQEVKLCTNFGEFKKFFGDFSEDSGQNTLAHAVYGFFRNGGTRCYVVWVTGEEKIDDALNQFEAIDEIAIVAAPGIISKNALSSINAHCKNMGDRVAIFDTPETQEISKLKPGIDSIPGNSDYAALYFPWIQVFDPATKKEKFVPPSGHIAGVYARVDSQRGVHKAPANEVLVGAVGLKQNISKNQQDGLNPKGINCIRNLNGNIKVWGARTLGGNDNGEFKYINVRRLFNYLKKSIDEGTQWTVFEPNSPELWARIRRNVTAFLMIVWRSGALFGNTPEQAFYVKCDEETNPPELREQGQVVTEIGVAIVRPAEFVIFHLSQWSGPGK
ncbi:MAG TPA: phage tail sheath subtilisin-like domain-containing protein [Phormidium sp.]